MKKITLLFTLLVSFSGFAQFPLPYCPQTFTSNVEPITLVNFAGINNTSSALVGQDNGTTIIALEDYTAIIGNVTAGSSYPITLKGNTDGGFTTYLRVYVDWNQNNDFTDAGESYDVGTIVNSTGADAVQLVGNIAVPPSALTGNTRMRVVKRFNIYGTSCQTGAGYGQAEDYTLTVAALPPDLPDYVNLQSPFTATIAQGGNVIVYGQVYEAGLTDVEPGYTGQATGISAWIGVNSTDTDPNTWLSTVWIPATWNSGSIGNNDEYKLAIGATLIPGTYYYATRFQLNGGAYVYGGTNNIWNGTTAINGVLTVTPPPPPANDDCSGAIGLTVNPDFACGTVTSGTTLGATLSMAATPCLGNPDDDVWFSFVATASSQNIVLSNIVAIGGTGTSTDAYMQVLSGACGSQTSVLCSDPNTAVPTGLTIGDTYYVRVYTYGTTNNITFNICVGTPPPPPVNDDCAAATPVTCGSVTPGTTTNATNENMVVCGISGVTTQNTAGVWYKYVGDGSDVTVTTCSPTITTGDSRIAVYSGSCGTLTCIGGNDDALAAGCANNTLASVVTFSTVASTNYYILVYSYTSAINFELSVNCVAACSPATANDDCATASPLTVGTTVTGADNLCSSPSLNVTYPTCGNQFGTYYDTWYSFGTGTSTDFTITLGNTAGTTGFALYSGTCGSLTMVAGSCSTMEGSLPVTGLTPGTTYFLRVFSTAPASRGSFNLTVSETLGTGSFDSTNFAYYPNPVKNILNLSYNQEISTVEVFNLLGQKVITNAINANAAQIDMSNVSKGAYMVKVTSNKQAKTIRVIKE